MSKLKGLAELVQDAIDKGATSVEEVHKAVLNQPLDVLEKVGPLEKPVQAVREIQNRTIGSVYDVIRKVNEEVATLAKEMLSRNETTSDGG
jgi:nitrate/TMAO reductase-like tetraheme cytochrome c subunit